MSRATATLRERARCSGAHEYYSSTVHYHGVRIVRFTWYADRSDRDQHIHCHQHHPTAGLCRNLYNHSNTTRDSHSAPIAHLGDGAAELAARVASTEAHLERSRAALAAEAAAREGDAAALKQQAAEEAAQQAALLAAKAQEARGLESAQEGLQAQLRVYHAGAEAATKLNEKLLGFVDEKAAAAAAVAAAEERARGAQRALEDHYRCSKHKRRLAT